MIPICQICGRDCTAEPIGYVLAGPTLAAATPSDRLPVVCDPCYWRMFPRTDAPPTKGEDP